jgi:hypothetical protein
MLNDEGGREKVSRFEEVFFTGLGPWHGDSISRHAAAKQKVKACISVIKFKRHFPQ